MYLLKNRDYFILDGELLQADVSFKQEDCDEYKKGYYMITCKINVDTETNKVRRYYGEGEITLLEECNEENEDILKEALIKKESVLKSISNIVDYFEREEITIKSNTLLKYSSTSVATNATNTISILNKLKENFEKYNRSKPTANKKNSKNKFSKDKDADIEYTPKKHTGIKFDDIAGLKEVKEELLEVVDFIKNPDKYKKMDAEIEKGIILYGPPGTGKTLIAKALASETNSNFFDISGSEFIEKYVGIGAKRVRKLFEAARKNAPSIIFIDELDAVGKKRGSGQGSDEREQTINELLVQLDGFNNNNEVLVIAATNRIELLDSALTRSGRLGQHIYIGNPDLESRKELFKIHTSKKILDPEVDINEFAKKTHSFSGADIKQVCNTAALLAIRDDKESISIHHFDKAIDKAIIGLHSKTKKAIDKERKIVAYHESGHAILNKLTNNKDLRKISIIPTGTSLGFVYNLPNEDRYLSSKSQLKNEIKVLLAGKVSEEIIFGEATSGASNDLQKASNIALKMVREYGMDEENGLLTVINENDSVSKEERDRAEAILKDCYKECRNILNKHKELLDHIANELLEKEELNSDDFEGIIKQYPNFTQ